MPSPYVESILQGLGAGGGLAGGAQPLRGERRRGECTTNADCEPGQRCQAGVCRDISEGGNGEGCRARCNEEFQACRENCSVGGGTSAACMASCANRFQTCVAGCGEYEACTTNADCPEGQRCINGKCQSKGEEEEGECYKMGPTRPNYDDCQCGVAFAAPDGSKCPGNYTWVPRGGQGWELWEEGMHGRCECTRWMEAHTPGGPTPGGLGEFEWPPELQALYRSLMGRAGEFMGRRPGYSDAILRSIFGEGFEGIRGMGGRTREEMMDFLASQGLVGTGAGKGMAETQAWQTEKMLGDLRRDVGIRQAEQIREDLLGFTEAAQGLFGTGMGYTQIAEAINAARRGEGTEALEMLLQLLMGQYQSWG